MGRSIREHHQPAGRRTAGHQYRNWPGRSRPAGTRVGSLPGPLAVT